MTATNSIRATLAKNLDQLMRSRDPKWTQEELAKAAVVSQRTISNMLSGHHEEKSGSTVSSVDAVAGVFGMQSWQLLVPGLPADPTDAASISDVVNAYILADDDGKDLIHKVAEREGRYKRQA